MREIQNVIVPLILDASRARATHEAYDEQEEECKDGEEGDGHQSRDESWRISDVCRIEEPSEACQDSDEHSHDDGTDENQDGDKRGDNKHHGIHEHLDTAGDSGDEPGDLATRILERVPRASRLGGRIDVQFDEREVRLSDWRRTIWPGQDIDRHFGKIV